jgi:hypothetical protein
VLAGAAADATGATAEVTGAAAGAELEVLAESELEALAGATADVTVVAAEVTGAAADVAQVAGEETGDAEVAQVAAEETGDAVVGGEVAAWAWREKTSRTARIPAAKIAACIAR